MNKMRDIPFNTYPHLGRGPNRPLSSEAASAEDASSLKGHFDDDMRHAAKDKSIYGSPQWLNDHPQFRGANLQPLSGDDDAKALLEPYYLGTDTIALKHPFFDKFRMMADEGSSQFREANICNAAEFFVASMSESDPRRAAFLDLFEQVAAYYGYEYPGDLDTASIKDIIKDFNSKRVHLNINQALDEALVKSGLE